MKSYEIMKRNIEFKCPERIGLRFNSLGVSDVYRIYTQIPRSLREDRDIKINMNKKPRPFKNFMDEWGCGWDKDANTGSGDMGMVVDNPLKDWSMLDDLPIPDPYAEGRFDGLEEALESAGDKYIQLNSPQCLFERMHFLRGFENLLMDIYTEPDKVKKLADKVIDYQIGIVKEAYRLSEGRINCFDTTDDWGTQNSLLISPDLWREIFKPRYKRLMDVIKECGMHIRFHTDGKVNDLMEDFIELGFDIVNIHQPQLLGIEEIGEKYAGRICFEASIDIQATLPTGDKKAIEDEVKKLIEYWSTPKGGLIAVEYRYLDAIGATKESLQFALECFQKHGKL
ncbi:hypothetical protein SH1V18_23490 [Vallitalea longa]|uniref:Uroporphyrinogen decarboxylase (URO-D) domain-containing protein n=1 Tax=Vallitalea longa TaxID=2936439 RepID=A0A9W6DGK9_9FIRM|nr:uroporphyrinogen decarboxylase family protein [Vallitalea longa]GKX29869.1 hypothetical protein SH1V18_23490 [Vallitalea longa]